jgi:hypothetical protein
VVGLVLMVTVIPIPALLDIVEGRLLDPVYGIRLSFELLKLVPTIYHRGMRTV